MHDYMVLLVTINAYNFMAGKTDPQCETNIENAYVEIS